MTLSKQACFIFFCSLFALFVANPLYALNSYKEQVLQNAVALELSANSQWWDLVHYQEFTFPPVVKSLVDDERFFISSLGKADPEKELLATIEGLFEPAALKDKHVLCRFPARSDWLIRQLEIAKENLPNVVCEEFQTWYHALDPKSLTLIFPSAYPNNPSSAFGHTLIRIDQRNTTALLSYTANFSADATDSNALIYAVKGIFGGYSGVFSNAPYFKKVQQYGDLESRDIWEYPLNLTDEEVAQGVRHIWELREMKFDYFYFDENCSYQLLSIIDVAKPGTDLLSKFSLWVIPVDTVRVVTEVPGLVGDVEFRPSTVRLLKAKIDAAEVGDVALAKSLALGSIESDSEQIRQLSVEKQAFVVDLAYDYLQYLLIARKKDTEDVRASMYHFLRARSAIDVSLPVEQVATPAVRPEQGHKSSRLRFSYGLAKAGVNLGELEFRPAYHDLLDPSGGYTEGAGIEFFSAKVRLQEAQGVELEAITPLSILSITPWNRLTSPTSWYVDLKSERKKFSEAERKLVSQAATGFGVAYDVFPEVVAYSMLGGEVGMNSQFKDNYNVGGSARSGIILFPARDYSLRTTAGATHFFAGETHNEFNMTAEGRYSLSSDVALRASFERYQEVHSKDFEAKLSLDLYF